VPEALRHLSQRSAEATAASTSPYSGEDANPSARSAERASRVSETLTPPTRAARLTSRGRTTAASAEPNSSQSTSGKGLPRYRCSSTAPREVSQGMTVASARKTATRRSIQLPSGQVAQGNALPSNQKSSNPFDSCDSPERYQVGLRDLPSLTVRACRDGSASVRVVHWTQERCPRARARSVAPDSAVAFGMVLAVLGDCDRCAVTTRRRADSVRRGRLIGAACDEQRRLQDGPDSARRRNSSTVVSFMPKVDATFVMSTTES
jgi:hypothetical protein